MKIAHVRESSAPAGAPWRLAGALDPGERPGRWLDLEVARRRAVAANGNLAHNAALYRSPLTSLDDHLARGLRVEALRELLEGFEARDDDDPVDIEFPFFRFHVGGFGNRVRFGGEDEEDERPLAQGRGDEPLDGAHLTPPRPGSP